MEFLTLGRSGLHVSRACLGAMMFGHSSTAPCDEADARRIIDAFLGRRRQLHRYGQPLHRRRVRRGCRVAPS